MSIISSIFSQYFYLRQTVPILLYAFYAHFREENDPIIEIIMKMSVLVIGLLTAYMILGYSLRIPLKKLIPVNLSYTTSITWGLFFLIYYYILNRKEEKNLTAFTLATLATVGGGWLYEVPFFHSIGMFLGKGSFFYNNIQLMCVLFLLLELRKNIFNPNPIL